MRRAAAAVSPFSIACVIELCARAVTRRTSASMKPSFSVEV